ncbi:MAG: ThuA domain-containing protein [Clostridiales bacterium]|jgi:trehalose utilization protein|nr:ThuA domain-containing protein [Clostridiales bacterium]
MEKSINVTVWCETGDALGAYPQGLHNAIAEFLSNSNNFKTVRAVSLEQPEQGMSEEILRNTDVLLWWGHCFHHLVSEETAERVHKRVLSGMGLIVLHSGHASKIFQRLLGTETNKLRWREIGERERVWKIAHHHPITEGVPEYFDIPKSEMYGEFFHIPAPEELLFISWYEGGEVFRSGCTFTRGGGKIFFFSPGHESYPIYYMPEIQRILVNAAKWAAPPGFPEILYDEQKTPPEGKYGFRV